MKDAQQPSIGFTRREAMQIGLETVFNTAVAAADAPAAEAAERERLAISFRIWALWDTATHGFFHDLELRITELVERGFNCIRIEAVSYCADRRLRWEERSDAYWEVVEHAARAYREHGLWGAVARTNFGPEDPVWHECPERLQQVNATFLGKKVS